MKHKHKSPNKKKLSETQIKFQKALSLHHQGFFQEAEKFYDQVIRTEPNHFDALHYLGVIDLQYKLFTRGLERINRALEINPNMPSAH